MAAQQAESKVYSLIHQGITALPLIQSHAREHHEQQRFTAQTEAARQQKMAQQGLEVFYWGSISVILSACTLGVTWVGAQQVLAANLTVGELLVFLAYVAQLFEPLHQLSQVGATLSSASASTRRVFEILDTPEEVKNRAGGAPGRAGDATSTDRPDCPPRPTTCSPPPAARPPRRPVRRSRSTATSPTTTSPSRTTRSRPVLRHVSFKLLAGTSAAIIGPSGAGKTTLVEPAAAVLRPGERRGAAGRRRPARPPPRGSAGPDRPGPAGADHPAHHRGREHLLREARRDHGGDRGRRARRPCRRAHREAAPALSRPSSGTAARA